MSRKCTICREVIEGEYGHNAEPADTGRCCDDCNKEVVIPTRILNSHGGSDLQARQIRLERIMRVVDRNVKYKLNGGK